MVTVNERCTGCGICVPECPTGAMKVEGKLAVAGDDCVQCGLCIKVCNRDAIEMPASFPQNAMECQHCPVLCKIPEGKLGGCRMYRNVSGTIVRDSSLQIKPRVVINYELERALSTPLLLGIGAGTNYPDFLPSPYIAEENIEGIDVVTAVTEVPLSYSSIKVKIDTNMDIGPEGAKVKRDGRLVGIVTTEEYGAKMLSIGGVRLISGPTGSTAARTIVDIANRKRVNLKVQGGADLEIQVGMPPVINGVEDTRMRVGCGSATLGIFGEQLKEVADEVIVLDPHITGLLTEHMVGKFLGLKYSGIVPVGHKSTIGRYFGEAGDGWGGTKIKEPEEAIASIDMNVAWPGMTIFIVDTNGERAAMLEVQKDGTLKRISLTPRALELKQLIAESSEPARVSALYVGGVGGSARAGLSRTPMEVNKAVRAGLMKLTVAGAPTFILPGGNIIFMVDVERVPAGAFHWTPTPATIVPVEYTTTREVFERIGGRVYAIRPLKEILQSVKLEVNQPS